MTATEKYFTPAPVLDSIGIVIKRADMPSYARFVQLCDELNAMSLFQYILAFRKRREFEWVRRQYEMELFNATIEAGERLIDAR